MSKLLISLSSKVLVCVLFIGILGSCGSKKEESTEEVTVEEVVESTEEEAIESMEENHMDQDSTTNEPTAEENTESN